MNNKYLLDYNNEIFRKIIHLSSLLIPITFHYTSFNFFISILLILLLAILLINRYYLYLSNYKYINIFLLNSMRSYEKKTLWGATYLILGFVIITLLFNKFIVILSMIISSFSDSMAAIIGIKFGKFRIFNNKSIEGFYVFFISTFTIVFILSQLPLLYIFIISFTISLTELLTPAKYDNLAIPLSSSIILYLFML